MSNTAQLEKNIAFCIDDCDMNDDQIGEMLRCIERMGIASVEHFCEEFVFVEIDENGEDAMSKADLNLNSLFFLKEIVERAKSLK